MRRRGSVQWRIGLLVSVGIVLVGCIAPQPVAPGTVPPSDEEIPEERPSAETKVEQEISARFAESLGLGGAEGAASPPGIEGVYVFAVAPPGEPRLWVAHTLGLRDILGGEAHTLAVYTEVLGRGVEERARLTLAEDPASSEPAPMPDYVGVGGVRQALIDPSTLWLAVDGGTGAHGGVYHLLRLTEDGLVDELAASAASPGVGEERDLDGDGIGEVLLNRTDPYVFCYACGVRIPAYDLWRWSGRALEQVEVSPLPAEASAAAHASADRLRMLASHGLWMDVDEELAHAAALADEDPSGILGWNVHLLRVNAEARRAQVETSSAFPLLDHLFYGDAAGAEAILRAATPEAIFSLRSPLIVGTVAEGWEDTLAMWLKSSTDAWLEVTPDLPAAYFLRAWAAYLVGDTDAALLDVEQAARSGDPFYADALEFLRGVE